MSDSTESTSSWRSWLKPAVIVAVLSLAFTAYAHFDRVDPSRFPVQLAGPGGEPASHVLIRSWDGREFSPDRRGVALVDDDLRGTRGTLHQIPGGRLLGEVELAPIHGEPFRVEVGE